MLPYHNLGLSQYTALGLDYSLHHIKPPNDAHMEMLRDLIIAADVFCITPGNGYESQSIQPRLKMVGYAETG
jgi:hypothetical protein